jgi:CHASE2 domain-containing sensor protein
MSPDLSFRSLGVAAAVVALLAGLALTLGRPVAASFDGAVLALLQVAANRPVTAPVLWIDVSAASPEAPPSRGEVAAAVEVARAGGARAIVLAVPLDQPEDNPDLARVRSFLDGSEAPTDAAMRARLVAWAGELDHDARLEAAIRAAGNVVLMSRQGADGAPRVAPLDRFAAVARGIGLEPAGTPDADGVTRQEALLIDDGAGGGATPSLAFAAWLAATGARAADVHVQGHLATAGAERLRTGPGTAWVPLYGRRAAESGGTPRVGLKDIATRKPEAGVAGRVVVVGTASGRINVATGRGLAQSEALAQRIGNLLSGDYAVMQGFARAIGFLLLLLSILWAGLVAPRLVPAVRLVTSLGIALALVGLEVVLLAQGGTWLPLAMPAVALLLATVAVAFTPERRAVRSERPTSAVPPMPRPAPRSSAPVNGEKPVRPASPAVGAKAAARASAPPAAPVAEEPFNPASPGQATPASRRKVVTAAEEPAESGPPTPYTSLREISRAIEARREEPTRAEAADLLLGRSKRPARPRLGRYELERELGRGAMGTVFLGRDPRINRVVAIKAIPIVDEFAENDLAEARDRFFREAEMAGRLKHPGIVTVHDAGEDGGIAWIAMEYVRGRVLSEFAVAERLLPPMQVLEICARIADALEYAHAENVIHRDIKPANVIFDPVSLATKITDFGIARLTDSSATRTGVVLGTPSFMSPEQLEARNVTGRSDLFSLGVTLFQLLAGQLPFRADSMTGLMDKIANTPHPPMRSIRPDLPPCVSAIVDRALMKEQAMRFATAGEMARALRACARTLSA